MSDHVQCFTREGEVLEEWGWVADSPTSGGWWGPGRYAGQAYDSSRWDGFVFRTDDVVVCAPQKCGTTWAQMICALLIFQTDHLPAPLGVLSPWLDSNTAPLAEVSRPVGRPATPAIHQDPHSAGWAAGCWVVHVSVYCSRSA